MNFENPEGGDKNYEKQPEDPEELKALIASSEEELLKLTGEAREMMAETIRVNKEKLAKMEGNPEKK